MNFHQASFRLSLVIFLTLSLSSSFALETKRLKQTEKTCKKIQQDHGNWFVISYKPWITIDDCKKAAPKAYSSISKDCKKKYKRKKNNCPLYKYKYLEKNYNYATMLSYCDEFKHYRIKNECMMDMLSHFDKYDAVSRLTPDLSKLRFNFTICLGGDVKDRFNKKAIYLCMKKAVLEIVNNKKYDIEDDYELLMSKYPEKVNDGKNYKKEFKETESSKKSSSRELNN